MKSLRLFALMASLLLPVAGHAQYAVFDAANHIENALTATRELLQIENQLTDLAALSDLGAFADLLQQAQELYGQVQQIAGPLLGRYGRWGQFMQAGPSLCNPYKLSAWTHAYDTESAAAFQDAAQAKPLLTTATKSLQSLVQVVQQAIGLHGTVQGLQTLSGLMGALLNRTVAIEAQNASFQETVQRKDLKDHVVRQALRSMRQSQLTALDGRSTCL